VAHVWADRVAETTTTIGTGALALTAVAGYQRFSAVCSTNDTVIYALEAVDANGVPTGDWETGIGTYSSANTLTRTTVLKSSNSNSVVTLAAGTKNVFLDDIASTRNTLQQYSGTSEPSAPVEGLINFAKDFNGWAVPYGRGATGRSFALDPYMSGRPWCGRAFPVAASATVQGLGLLVTAASAATVSTANTNAYTRFVRLGINTTATASSVASIREGNTNIFLRGTNALDGARVTIRFGIEVVGNTNCRWFVGLMSAFGAQAATFDPATATNLIGIGASGTDTTNAKIYYNDGAGTPSTIDLGSNYPAKTAQTAMIELTLWAESSASSVKYYIRRLDDLSIAPTTGSLSTDIPTAGTAMFLQCVINNNATAAASQLSWSGFIVELGF
jgi:hypothetical protein